MLCYTFRWCGQASSVKIALEVFNWRQFELPRSDNTHELIIELPPTGKLYLYKYLVDDVWSIQPGRPVKKDTSGNSNNYITFQELQQGLGMGEREGVRDELEKSRLEIQSLKGHIEALEQKHKGKVGGRSIIRASPSPNETFRGVGLSVLPQTRSLRASSLFSLTSSTVSHSGTSRLLGVSENFAAIQRPLTGKDLIGLIVLQIVDLLSYWAGGWDATQAAYLKMFSLAPLMHYMHTFQPTHFPLFPTLAVYVTCELISLYLPLLFLRPSSPDSKPTPAKKENFVFDSTRLLTTLFTNIIYQLVLYSASRKFLVGWLTNSGWELESVVLLAETAMMIPIGCAASEIIYSPNGASGSAVTAYPATENKEGLEEGETGGYRHLFRMYFKSLSPWSQKIVKRTLLVAAKQGSVTIFLILIVKGGDLRGGVGIIGVWAVATVIVGVFYGGLERFELEPRISILDNVFSWIKGLFHSYCHWSWKDVGDGVVTSVQGVKLER